MPEGGWGKPTALCSRGLGTIIVPISGVKGVPNQSQSQSTKVYLSGFEVAVQSRHRGEIEVFSQEGGSTSLKFQLVISLRFKVA